MKDYFGYNGKVCVVTGAASGMGKATAEMLVDLGAKVYALDWAEVKVDGIEKYIHTDLSKKESIDEAFKQIPLTIHSYFGIAGVSGAITDFATTVTIDFVSNKYICYEYLMNRMQENASIAFITSTGGNGWELSQNKNVYLPVVEATGWDETMEAINKTGLAMLPGTLGYPFSKLAMNYMAVSMQKDFAPKGIRVNAVLPGSTKTGLVDQFEKMAGGMDNLLSHCGYASRLATSEEMAQPIVFLNSNMATYISGELVAVDYAQTSEEHAGFKVNETICNLEGILAHLKAMKEKK